MSYRADWVFFFFLSVFVDIACACTHAHGHTHGHTHTVTHTHAVTLAAEALAYGFAVVGSKVGPTSLHYTMGIRPPSRGTGSVCSVAVRCRRASLPCRVPAVAPVHNYKSIPSLLAGQPSDYAVSNADELLAGYKQRVANLVAGCRGGVRLPACLKLNARLDAELLLVAVAVAVAVGLIKSFSSHTITRPFAFFLCR